MNRIKTTIMRFKKEAITTLIIASIIGLTQCKKDNNQHNPPPDPQLISDGQNIFRFDSFGDEDFWSGLLHIDKAIAGSAHGGFGTGVSPKSALAVGLKVDAQALPSDIVAGIQSGKVNLDDPATTLALIKLNAVLGIKGNFNSDGSMKSLGITCAVCHSTVDNSFA